MKRRITFVLTLIACSLVLVGRQAMAVTSQSGSTGIQGTISAPPPSQGASISIPHEGQVFNQLPITVSGLCPGDLLVKLFKNNVFSGSVQCKNNSFSLQTDLFSGDNQLIVRVYDSLDQPGPDSNLVTVNFSDAKSGTGPRVSLTSNYAKRGANPGEVLSWPIILSGGTGPYAISVDWGDSKAPDLQSQQFPGTITIKHTYNSPGVYNIIIKASDASNGVSYLQLVGITNGALSQDTGSSSKGAAAATTTTKTTILWQPAAILVPFIIATFWLGKRYELYMIRKRIETGDRPF